MSRRDKGAGAATDLALAVAATRLRRLNLSHDDFWLRQLLGPIERWERGAVIAPLNRLHSPRMLVSGWGFRQIIGADGRRQIIGFVLPGDVIGLEADTSWSLRSEVGALTPVLTVCVRRLLNERASNGSIGSAIAAAQHHHALSQIIRLGAQSARERIGSLVLELKERLETMDLVRADGSFPFPLTHEHLADATGLSAVHVNRVLQDLRRSNLIELQTRHLKVHQPELLQEGARAMAVPRARCISDGFVAEGLSQQMA